MSEIKTEVHITATNDTASAFNAAAGNAENAAKRINTANSDINTRMKAVTDGVRGKLSEMTSQVKSKIGEAMGHIGSQSSAVASKISDTGKAVSNAISRMASVASSGMAALAALTVVVLALAAAIAIMVAGFRAVKETAEHTSSMMSFGRSIGMTATQANIYNLALQKAGASTSEFKSAAQGLSGQLAENEKRMNAMGLVTRDAEGNLRPLNELTVEAATLLNQYKEGTDRAAAAQDLFGTKIDNASGLMKLNKDAIAEADQMAKEYGLTVGERSVKAYEDFEAASQRANMGMQGIKKAAGDALLPVLTELSNMFSSVLPTAIDVVRVVCNSLATAFYVVKAAVEVVIDYIATGVRQITIFVAAASEALSRLANLDFEGAKAAISDGFNEMAAQGAAAQKRAQDSISGAAMKISTTWEADTTPGASGSKAGTRTHKSTKKGSKGDASRDNRAAEWAAELEAIKLQFAEEQRLQGTHYEYSKAAELKFWQEKLALVDKNSKSGIDIRKKILAVERQIQKEREQLREVEINGERTAANHAVQMQEQRADQMLALGQINNEQRLEMQRQFENERYQIAERALLDRLAKLEDDPVSIAKLNEQKLELEREFQRKKAEIRGKIDIEQQSPIKNMVEGMESAFTQAFQGILQRTMTFRQAMGNLFNGLSASFAQESAKMVAQAAISAIKQTAIWQAMFATQAAGQAAASAATTATKSTETTAVVTANAAQAASGAAASQASIPYVGPALAVAAAGAMMALVLGMLGGGGGSSTTTTTRRIPSAARGWDIPAGINPLTQLHEEEMVLPAESADIIRGMGNQGSGETIVINATGGDWINKRDLGKLLRKMNRDFKFT